jgi:peptidoglycan/xylan/chitin deacetylase (PgdA/CDA1 family)
MCQAHPTLCPRLVRITLLAAALLFPASASVPVFAASPFPSPQTPAQLACDLSPANDPGDYTRWWAAVPGNGTYVSWLWNQIVPNATASSCHQDTAQTFWQQAVPGNWVPIGNIGGWPWASGGYYTQVLWLQAIPGNWATVPNIGGWPWASGGFYTQTFWLHAVPDNWALIGDIGNWPWSGGGYYTQWFWLHAVADNWASVADIGGWAWPSGGYYTQWTWLHAVPDGWRQIGDIGGWRSSTGGYYTQWLWLHAVPDNWMPSASLRLGHLPEPTANPMFAVGDQGYYRFWFWEAAVPDEWRQVANIGGWPWPNGGYYTQRFWLHAAPDQWAVNPEMAIDGTASAGYYDFTFYIYATVRDFAWRSDLSIGGSDGAGYFDYWWHGYFGQNVPHYRHLFDLGGGYLRSASTFVPVSKWYAAEARAVVALTFDIEGTQAETCAVTDLLRQKNVTSAFYLVGKTADELTPGWIDCLSGMDIEDHTTDHPGAFVLEPQTWISTLTNDDQYHQIHDDIGRVRDKIPDAAMTSFRTPNCDGNKAFDESVIRNSIASGMESDRSVATITDYARRAGVLPGVGLTQFSLSAFPSPFVVGTSGGKQLVEFPFTYPSDWTAIGINGLNNNAAPPQPDDPAYAVTVWEHEFDEIYAQQGIMVVLMHPWIQGAGGRYPDGLSELIDHMQSKPGVVFTTAARANASYRRAMGSGAPSASPSDAGAPRG